MTKHLLVPDSILGIGIEILTVGVDDVHASAGIKREYGLLTNDALNLALMRRHRLACIASNDSDFERVTDLLVWKPA